MQRHSFIYRLVNIFALLSMLVGLVPPAGAVAATVPIERAATEVSTPTAPSELAEQWPAPILTAENQPLTPFLDPTGLALEQALGDVATDIDLLGGTARLEPLAPGSLLNPSINLPQPQVVIPRANSPLAEIDAGLIQPRNLAAFTDQEKAEEAELPFDQPASKVGGSQVALTTNAAQPAGSPKDNPVQAANSLDLTVAESGDLSTTPENRPDQAAGALVRPALISETVGSEPVQQREGTQIYLPLVTKDGDTSSPPPPNPTPVPLDEVTITPAGGTLISTDGLVRVVVPAGAFTEPFILRYFAPVTATQRSAGGFFTLEAETQAGQPVVLNRAAQLSLRLPDHRSGRPLFFRQRVADQSRTVSVGAYVVTNTITADATGELLSAYLYEFGDFTFASIIKTSELQAKGLGISLSLGAQAEEEENPDEGDDGLVITNFCREPGTRGPDYTYPIVTVYTSTEEADPWAYLNIFWDEWTGEYDENDLPIIETKYDENNPYREDPDKIDYSNEPQVVMGIEEVGPYPSGKVLSFTLYVDDLGGPEGSVYRYDTMDEATFQAGTGGCISGVCGGSAPTIDYVDIWQSGQQAGGNTGTAIVEASVSDGSGSTSVSLVFNGQTIPMQPMPNGTYGATVTYPINQENQYEVTATDECGNTTTPPPITAWGSDSGHLGWNTCGKECGYQWPSDDPINTANGNFYDRVTDITVAGVGETDLVIERAYNSKAVLWTGATTMRYTPDGSGNYTEQPAAGPPQYFGPGWTFPYATYLLVVDKTPFYQGAQIHYADGRTVNFVLEGGVYVPDSPGNFDTLTLEGNEYVLRHKRTLEVERFNADGQLVAREDRNGNKITLTYDGKFLSRVENDSGRWLAFTYNADGLVETITAPEGKTLRYAYAGGLLTGYTDARSHTTTYAYNENNQLTTITTPKTHTSLEQTYDEKYRVNWQRIGRAEINAFTYSEDGLVTTMTDSYGHTTTYTYNELSQIIRVTDALGYNQEFAYDEDYNRIFKKDHEGREWHYTLNDRGMRTAEDGPMGWHREWEYNDLDLTTRMVEKVNDGITRETRFEYDSKGNLERVINALGADSQIVYDSRGLPTNVFDFNGYETINSYNPATGDLLKTRNGAGDEAEYIYDDLGRLVTMTNGRGFVYSYAYDGNDNLTGVSGPMTYHLEYQYDPNDNLSKEIDPNDGEIDYFYDQSEKLVRVENQLDFPTLYAYDDMNNLVRLEDAEGRVWIYEYDAVYNRTAAHGPEDTHTFYAYNGVRKVIGITRCNGLPGEDACARTQVTHYEFDDLDRVVRMVENHQPGHAASPDTNVTTGYEYDLVGNLLALIDANGNRTTYQYDPLDRLIRQEDAEQQVARYGYDDNGNLTSLVNPRDYETKFTYDGANRLASTTDAMQNTWFYTYDHNGNLENSIDPLQVVTHHTYDGLDRLASLTLNYVEGAPATVDQNVTTYFEHDPAGNLRFVYDPRGTYKTEHRYDLAHRRIKTIDAEGGETEFGYDDVGNLTSLIDPNDHQTGFDYDGLDRQVRVTNPEGHSVRSEYDRLGNLLVLTDARNHPTHFSYDGMNRPVLRVDALNGEWRYEYDAMGNVLREIDAISHPNNSYSYDRVYRLLTSTDAENHTTSYSYDKNGNTLTRIDGNDHTTTYTYDPLDRLETLTNPEQETTTYRYDPLGNQTELVEADGIVTLYEYDPLYRLVTVVQNYRPGEPESADANVDTRYGYDQVGNLLTILNAEENSTFFSYDGLNRLKQEVDALGNTWDYEYDPAGNRTARVDANRNRTDYSYYNDNQLRQIAYYDGTSVEYRYDENNNRVQMTDHLGVTTWVFDPLNRLTDATDPFNRHLSYSYDPVGNRTGLTYPDGRTVRYTYYNNNWLKTVIDPEGNTTVYDRDGIGQMTRTLNPNATVTEAAYDRADRLLAVRNYQVGGAGKVNSAFSYTYNDVGHRTRMVAEYGWRNPAVVTSNYTYDGLRRLVRDEDSEGVWTRYEFDRVGNRLKLETNNSSFTNRPRDELTLSYTYNEINQVLTIIGDTHPGQPGTKREDNTAQALHAFRHEVAAQAGKHISRATADTLLAMADALLNNLYGNPAPKEADVAADLAALRDRITAARASGEIDLDGIENSLLVKLDQAGQANAGATGELQTTTFSYDANGNRVNKEFPGPQGPRIQGTDYGYDPENRLIVAQDYQMNEQGNRVERQVTRLAYDGNGRRLVKEYDPKDGGGGTKRTEYVFDGLDPVAEYSTQNPQYENFYRGDLSRIITMHHFPNGTQGQMFWYHYDGLGSTSGLTKQNGQSSHNYRYEAYGQIELPPGNFTDPHNHYTFTGQELDEKISLYEFYARAYDPLVGVWMQQDVYRGRLPEPTTLHRYGYVGNNPTTYIDKQGFIAWMAVVAVVVVVTEVVDYAWTAWDAYQATKTLNDSEACLDEKLSAATELFLTVGFEAIEPDEWFPGGVPLDDAARKLTMSQVRKLIKEEGSEAAIEFLRKKFGDAAAETIIRQAMKSSPSSRKLGENLVEAGVERADDVAAHHIVAGSSKNAEKSREILENFDIDINSADNGVFLPQKSTSNARGAYHPSLHTNEYYNEIYRRLSRAQTREEALEILNQTRDDLLHNKFPY